MVAKGMNGAQAAAEYEVLWEQWLRDVAEGRKQWPLKASGKVHVSDLAKPAYTGISRNALYGRVLKTRVEAAIEEVEANEGKRLASTLNEMPQNSDKRREEASDSPSKATIGAQDELDKANRRIRELEQQITVLQAALDRANSQLNQYEYELNTGLNLRPYGDMA